MSGLPKLNMAAVKDTDKDKKEKKDKTTAKEKLKKFSASMKRGLTPRGSLARSMEEIEKDYALKPTSSEETDPRLVGALGPRDSSYGISDSDSDATGGGSMNLEAASSTAASAAAFVQPPADYSSAPQDAPPPADPQPLVASPPAKHEPLPQFEPAGEAARAAREEAAEAAPEPAEPQPTADEEDDAPSKVSSGGGRGKWQEVVVAVGIFTLGIVLAEPAMDAWRRRGNKKQPPAPIDAVAAKKKGGWGFS